MNRPGAVRCDNPSSTTSSQSRSSTGCSRSSWLRFSNFLPSPAAHMCSSTSWREPSSRLYRRDSARRSGARLQHEHPPAAGGRPSAVAARPLASSRHRAPHRPRCGAARQAPDGPINPERSRDPEDARSELRRQPEDAGQAHASGLQAHHRRRPGTGGDDAGWQPASAEPRRSDGASAADVEAPGRTSSRAPREREHARIRADATGSTPRELRAPAPRGRCPCHCRRAPARPRPAPGRPLRKLAPGGPATPAHRRHARA